MLEAPHGAQPLLEVTVIAFTEEEWSQKNQYYWDLDSTTYDILSVEIVPDSDSRLR